MYVKTSELSPIIKRFINNHNSEHPKRVGGNQGTSKSVHVPVIAGTDYICKRSGVGITRLQRIIDCDYPSVSFVVADKIMCAIDRPDVFTNGEVEILHE